MQENRKGIKKGIRGFHKRNNFRIIICVETLLSLKYNNRGTSTTELTHVRCID